DALWPTPSVQPSHRKLVDGRNISKTTGERYGVSLPQKVGGQLNPRWVEWLMGVPIGWVSCAPLEMHRFRSWQQKHGVG
ncbi:unnamed protein product, partial [marine sediment metagenome]